MRILHTIPGRNWGGLEFRVIEQTQWLNAHGHQAWLATPKNGESHRRAVAAGLPVIDFNFGQPWRWGTIRKMRALLLELRIEVADVHVTRDAKALMACLDLTAVVRSRHTTQRLKPGLLRSLQWRLGSDAVIAVAECVRTAMLADGLADPARAHVVGEWADDVFFRPADPDARSRLRQAWGCKDTDVAIATVSMLRPDKGLEFAINALPALLESGLPVKLVILGGATEEGAGYFDFLKGEAVRLGIDRHVVFPGYCENVDQALAAVDMVVVPSISNEAQSRIVPQAFAVGKPVVATRVGGLTELVHDGKTGLLAPPRDSFALAKAIERLAGDADLSARLALEAKTFAEAHLRMDRQMEATLAIYVKALERARIRSYLRMS
ncbi:MAG: glycosyltransferase family 4 protein [Rhodospirillales bacterium]|jgi:glycosyltransferase involved in cell wall biosynthesis